LAACRLAVLRATEDVENAFSALVKREVQVGILTRGESSLAGARENALAAYKGGVASLIEVLDADSNLLQARDAKAQAQAEAARAAIASFRAFGGADGMHCMQAATASTATSPPPTAGKQNGHNKQFMGAHYGLGALNELPQVEVATDEEVFAFIEGEALFG
jgi:hypothetical protein